MTTTKLNGVYFTEQQATISSGTQRLPIFIVQTSTAIASIDNQILKYTNMEAFEAVVEGKGLTNTVKYMNQVLTENDGNLPFYVYSIKTDTNTAFTNIVKDLSAYPEITHIIYIEETKSSNDNSISDKISAIKAGLNYLRSHGHFKKAYIVPYGTIHDLITNKTAGTRDETVILNNLPALSNSVDSGAIIVTVPCSYAGAIVGKCINTVFDDDAGRTDLKTVITGLDFKFTDDEKLDLVNAGLMFIDNEETRNGFVYRIYSAVTTSFAQSKADGYLISRTICDEVLNDVKLECLDFIKAKESETSITLLNTLISGIIDKYVEKDDIKEDASYLNATEGETPYIIDIEGEIKPYGSTQIINVATRIE